MDDRSIAQTAVDDTCGVKVGATLPAPLWRELMLLKLERGRGCTLAALLIEAIERYLADSRAQAPGDFKE